MSSFKEIKASLKIIFNRCNRRLILSIKKTYFLLKYKKFKVCNLMDIRAEQVAYTSAICVLFGPHHKQVYQTLYSPLLSIAINP